MGSLIKGFVSAAAVTAVIFVGSSIVRAQQDGATTPDSGGYVYEVVAVSPSPSATVDGLATSGAAVAATAAVIATQQAATQARAERDRELDARMQWVAWYAGSRVTIKALVVAARAAVWALYVLAQGSFVTKEACITALRAQTMRAQQAENTAQFRAYLMGKNPDYLKQAKQSGQQAGE